MGATVVNGLTASFWAGRKPKDYKGTELDRALTSYEAVAGKAVKIPSNLIPAVPGTKVSEIDSCITKLKSAITELEKAKVIVNQTVTALQAVVTAANKTSAELNKLAKTPNIDGSAFENGAASASSVASLASSALKDVQ